MWTTTRPPVSALLITALLIGLGTVCIPLARHLPLPDDSATLDTVGDIFDAVAIGFAAIAALVYRERERLTGDAFASRFGAALLVLALGVIPFDLASGASDSTAPLAFGLAGRAVLMALLVTLAFAAPVSSTVRLSKVALAGLVTTGVVGSVLLVTPGYATLVERQSPPLTRPALFAVVVGLLIVALVLAGAGFRRGDARFQPVVLLVAAMSVATSSAALDGGDDVVAFAFARLVQLVAVAGLLYAAVVELRQALLHERQHGLETRLETARAADRLIEQLRHQEEIVHDARSALLAIQGGVGAIKRQPVGADDLLTAVDAEIDRLRGALDGARDRSTRPFDVVAALQPMVLCYEVADFPVSLHTQGQPWAHGRAADTAEVVQNLIDNAIRHAVGDSILVWVGVGNDVVSIRVADRGPGVPADHRQRVTERGGSSGGSAGGGLGLYTARRLIEAQGGTLDIGDRVGGGAVFSINLRRAVPVDPLEQPPAAAAVELSLPNDR